LIVDTQALEIHGEISGIRRRIKGNERGHIREGVLDVNRMFLWVRLQGERT